MASHVRTELLKHARKVNNLTADNARLTPDEVFERFRSDYLEVMRKHPMDAVSIYENRIKPTLGHLPLIDITNVEVENLRKGQSHLSPQSTPQNLLGQVFHQAARWGLYEDPIPTDSDGRRMRFLTKAEAKTLSVADVTLFPVYRSSCWGSVSPAAGTITVMNSKNAMNRFALKAAIWGTNGVAKCKLDYGDYAPRCRTPKLSDSGYHTFMIQRVASSA